ncbi:hypothetical protein Tco_0912926, partial [Tanacetum coccineum]
MSRRNSETWTIRLTLVIAFPMMSLRLRVLEKSMEELEQVREKDKELFEETIKQKRKLNEESFETSNKETNDKLAEALAQS